MLLQQAGARKVGFVTEPVAGEPRAGRAALSDVARHCTRSRAASGSGRRCSTSAVRASCSRWPPCAGAASRRRSSSRSKATSSATRTCRAPCVRAGRCASRQPVSNRPTGAAAVPERTRAAAASRRPRSSRHRAEAGRRRARKREQERLAARAQQAEEQVQAARPGSVRRTPRRKQKRPTRSGQRRAAAEANARRKAEEAKQQEALAAKARRPNRQRLRARRKQRANARPNCDARSTSEEEGEAFARSGVVDEYRALLMQTIERNWIKPPSARAGPRVHAARHAGDRRHGDRRQDRRLQRRPGRARIGRQCRVSFVAVARAARPARVRAASGDRLQAYGVDALDELSAHAVAAMFAVAGPRRLLCCSSACSVGHARRRRSCGSTSPRVCAMRCRSR